jgi:HTH-type transcriptional regulator / antitoxin HigA
LDIKLIRTKADYRAALEHVESLMTAKPNTPKGDRLDVMAPLIEAYERAHFPMDLPDAVDAIKFRMEHSGLTIEDPEPGGTQPAADVSMDEYLKSL